MAVIITDMDMPKSCFKCGLRYKYGNGNYAQVSEDAKSIRKDMEYTKSSY